MLVSSQLPVGTISLAYAAMVADTDDAVAFIEFMARPTQSLSRADAYNVDQLCEVAKQVCRNATARLVAQADHEPCMQSSSADGTPIQVSQQIALKLPSGRLVRRSGKSSHEFLVAAQFTRHASCNGTVRTSFNTSDPVPLTDGKAADRIWEACRARWRSLRQLGHRGGAIQHYTFDRCGFAKLARRANQWHSLLEDQWAGDDESLNHFLPLLEWVVATPCALHDVQNAFKWGLPGFFADTELVRDCFIGIASVRNSFDLILKYIGEWVACSLAPANAMTHTERDEYRQVWTSLRVNADLVVVLTDVLELRVADEVLLVSADAYSNVADVTTTYEYYPPDLVVGLA